MYDESQVSVMNKQSQLVLYKTYCSSVNLLTNFGR